MIVKMKPEAPFEVLYKKETMTKVECNQCFKVFSTFFNLRKHVKRYHKDQLAELAPLKQTDYKFQCDSCGSNFCQLKYLRHHQKRRHKIALPPFIKEVPKKCPLCSFQSPSKPELLSHFQQEHGIDISTETIEFDCQEDFERWKDATEKDSRSKFVKERGSRSEKRHIKVNYICHRSGKYISEGKGLRRLKTKGSCKINGFCPASIKLVAQNDGKCTVQFIKDHVGHENDIGYLTLTTSERQVLADKLSSDMPFSTILDEFRNSVSGGTDVKRIHLLTKKDLHNIRSSFKLPPTSLNRKDGVTSRVASVEDWVNSVKDSGCVIFHKPKSTLLDNYPELKADDFILIIMNDEQKEVLKQHHFNLICIDGIYGPNSSGFQLNVLLVLDELKQGFPCAFLISNHCDETVLTVFLSCIKDHLGILLLPKVFMSNMDSLFYDAWLKVMPEPQYRFFTGWHLDKDWKDNLSKITCQEKQVEVYKTLRIILEEKNCSAFNKMLGILVPRLTDDPETQIFGNYFKKKYLDKPNLWAHCYLLEANVDTNTHIERMHKTINYIYLESKQTKRLDKTVFALMELVRDRLFDRSMVLHKGKKLSNEIKKLRRRHKESEVLDVNMVKETETCWEIASTNAEQNIVKEIGVECGCKIVCVQCDSCIHRYSCSCFDSAIKWNMCQHIHLVCRYRKGKAGYQLGTIMEFVDDDNLYIHCNEEYQHEDIKVHLEKRREMVKTQFLNILNSITNQEQMDDVEKIVAQIQPALIQPTLIEPALIQPVLSATKLETIETITSLNASTVSQPLIFDFDGVSGLQMRNTHTMHYQIHEGVNY